MNYIKPYKFNSTIKNLTENSFQLYVNKLIRYSPTENDIFEFTSFYIDPKNNSIDRFNY